MKEIRAIFDKNMIQGLNDKKLEIYRQSPYKILNTKALEIECLGNLTKKDKKYLKNLKRRKTTRKKHVATLFYKLLKFSLAKYDHMDLIRKELIEGEVVKLKHDFFDYKLVAKPGALDPFDYHATEEEIKRRAEEKFNLQDYEISCKYNKGLFEKMVELREPIQPSSLSHIINIPKLKKVSLLLFRYIVFTLGELGELRMLETIIKKTKEQSFCRLAPYTAYVFTTDSLFHQIFLPKWKREGSPKLGSNWIDFNYLYYLPFIDVLFSEDKIFKSIIIEEELKEVFLGKIDVKTAKTDELMKFDKTDRTYRIF